MNPVFNNYIFKWNHLFVLILISQIQYLILFYFHPLYCHFILLGHVKVIVNWNIILVLFTNNMEKHRFHHNSAHEHFHWWLNWKKSCAEFLCFERHNSVDEQKKMTTGKTNHDRYQNHVRGMTRSITVPCTARIFARRIF